MAVTTGAWLTWTVSAWLAFGETPLLAVNVTGYAPPAPVGVPAKVAVPSPLSVNVKPAGSEPDSVIEPTG